MEGKNYCASCRQYAINHKKTKRIKAREFIRKLKVWEITNPRLYVILKAQDITARELAAAAGVAERTVQRWLFESAEPVPENKEKVNKFLGTEVFELERKEAAAK